MPMPAQPVPISVSVEQMAEVLGVSRQMAYKLLDQGVIESRYMGRRRLVLYDSLRRYVEDLPTERQFAE